MGHSNPMGLTSIPLESKFDQLLSEIEYRNSRYSYGNVDTQISAIKSNLEALKDNPHRLKVYKENLVPHLEILGHQLKRLVA